jgi:Ca2+-binding EF-hand superfamily protein
MTLRVNSICLAGILLAISVIGVSQGAEPRYYQLGHKLGLLFPDGAGSQARLELQASIDGERVPVIWDESFTRLHAFFDRDASGGLDKTEARRLPSPFALRQVLWGQFSAFTGEAPKWESLDTNNDGQVSQAEMVAHYHWAGLGNVLVGVGKPTATDAMTSAILKHLDSSGDGKVNEAEWKAAAESLRKLDTNDDELIGPGELVPRTAYPGALGSQLLRPQGIESKPVVTGDGLPFTLLPFFLDKAIDDTDSSELWAINLGVKKPGQGTLFKSGEQPPASGQLTFTAGSVRLVLRADEGKLKEQTLAARKQYAAIFVEGDTSADNLLDEKELAAPKAGQLKQLAAVADRDGDGKLSEKELTVWLDLQEQIAKGHVLLTVLDHGSGLFELLDANHDGSLSVRELRTAWQKLHDSRCIAHGGLDRTKLPRHLMAVLSHGHPLTALGKPARTGPDWFSAMDRNGDGDVSQREFTGLADLFGKLDADKDSLLDPGEAAQAKFPK